MRQISTKKYALALVITIIIFSIGILVGTTLENARVDDSRQLTLKEKLNLRSLQLQESYIDSGLANCNTLNSILESNINELSKKGATIINYQKDSIFNEEDFKLQLRDYFLTELQFLLISQEIDQKCEKDSIKIIYFYNEDAKDNQGIILDYLKKKFKEKILVFSFNSDFAEPMISILIQSHNITQFPSVVIEDKVFQGHTKVGTLMKNICNELKKSNEPLPEDCLKLKLN